MGTKYPYPLIKCAVNIPPKPENALVDAVIVDATDAAPFFEGVSLAVETVKQTGSHVVHLRAPISPSAIARLVIAIYVNSVNGKAFRRLTHVCKEVFKRIPSLADGYASRTIVHKSLVIRVKASFSNALPNLISAGRFGHPVLGKKPLDLFGGDFFLKAPARLAYAALKLVFSNAAFRTAIATTKVKNLSRYFLLDPKNLPPTKSPCQMFHCLMAFNNNYKYYHGIGV